MARQHNYSAIHVGLHWKIQDRRQIKNADNTETKHNPEKANNAKHSRTKLPWFTLLRHSARKRGGLIPQCSRAHKAQASKVHAVRHLDKHFTGLVRR